MPCAQTASRLMALTRPTGRLAAPAHRLVKRLGRRPAADHRPGAPGSFFGLVGPNGAGKDHAVDGGGAATPRRGQRLDLDVGRPGGGQAAWWGASDGLALPER